MKIRSNSVLRAAIVSVSVFGVAGAALAAPPWAREHARYDRDSHYARVVNVEPIVHRVRVSTPQQECWSEDRPVYSNGSGTVARSTLLGGLIGAAVGHGLGDHHGRDPVAVIGGSLIGAAIGNSIGVDRAERRGEYREVGYQPVERCTVTYHESWEERVDGYRVTYVYHGREHTTRMPYDPGQHIRVNVDVTPEGRGEDFDN